MRPRRRDHLQDESYGKAQRSDHGEDQSYGKATRGIATTNNGHPQLHWNALNRQGGTALNGTAEQLKTARRNSLKRARRNGLKPHGGVDLVKYAQYARSGGVVAGGVAG